MSADLEDTIDLLEDEQEQPKKTDWPKDADQTHDWFGSEELNAACFGTQRNTETQLERVQLEQTRLERTQLEQTQLEPRKAKNKALNNLTNTRSK